MITKPESSQISPNLSSRQWVRLILVYLFMPLLLILCGGDIKWWQAWVYSALVILAGVGGRIWAEKRHPGLMAERVKSKRSVNIKPWDKILAPLVAVSVSYPLYIVAGLDHRFGWTKAFPVWLNILGLALVALGYAFGTWAIAENAFFSGVVRIQNDRGHQVCDTGPYKIVRHPGYSGNIVPLAGIVLALSSLWTIIPAAISFILIVVRTVLEDRTLQKELPGYSEYAARVRFRLFPGIY